MSADAEAEGPPGEEAGEEEEAGEQDPRLYSVRISRVTGIEWGTDLSFSWVYVRALQPSGAAANCGEVAVGDQVGFHPADQNNFFFGESNQTNTDCTPSQTRQMRTKGKKKKNRVRCFSFFLFRAARLFWQEKPYIRRKKS